MSYIIYRGKLIPTDPETQRLREAMQRRVFGPPLWQRLLIRFGIAAGLVYLLVQLAQHSVGPVYLP